MDFKEGETITIYSNKNSTANHGSSFKILRFDNRVMHLDSAPVDLSEPSTGGTDTIFIEANLLKNHTFQELN